LSDGVHAAVEGVEAPSLQPMIDRAGPQAEGGQLRPRHNAVLALRERRNPPVVFTSLTFAPYYGVNVRLVAHARHGGSSGRTAG
jgi:hypothetical protein